MNNSSLIAQYLKDERKRLGFSQAQAAEKCSVSREIWGKYERGATMPGSEVLYDFAQAGADIQYVFTGVRSGLALSPMERLFLDKLRVSDAKQQNEALMVLLGESSAVQQVFHGNLGQSVKGDIYQEGITFDLRTKK